MSKQIASKKDYYSQCRWLYYAKDLIIMINYIYEIRFLDDDEYNIKFDVDWDMTVFGFKRINKYLNNDSKCLKKHSLQRSASNDSKCLKTHSL